MKPFSGFSQAVARGIRFVLTDIDDTLTFEGRLHPETYYSLARLRQAGIKVIPVTGASAGWCDLMARMWPIDGIVGENGGFYFHRDAKGMRRRLWFSPDELARNTTRLEKEAARILAKTAGATTAWDQHYREITYAMQPSDFSAAGATAALISEWRRAGAQCTVNSLWVLAWFGEFNKLEMSRRMMAELFHTDLEAAREAFLYVGDSPNDEPMFGFFPHSVAVSTVVKYTDQLRKPPAWITEGPGGSGFVEVASAILKARRSQA